MKTLFSRPDGVPCAEQAGGLHGRNDGAVFNESSRLLEPLEVKSAICRKHKQCAFSFKRVVSGPSARWLHLFLVGRESNPFDWGSLRELDDCVWLGYVRRADYEAAVTQARRDCVNDLSASPGSRRHGWVSDVVKWTRFKNLTLARWLALVA